MSLLSAQIVSSIAAGIFALAIGVPLIRRYFGYGAGNVADASSRGFGKNDILIGAFLLVFYGISPLTAFSTAEASQAGAPTTEAVLTVGSILSAMLLQSLVLITIIVRLASGNVKELVGWAFSISLRQAGLIIGAVGATLLFFFLMQQTGLSDWIARTTESSPSQETVQQLQNGSTSIRIMIAISAVCFAPFFEELAFRGYLYPVCKKLTGPVFACIITSLLFGIVHMNLVVFLPLSLFGALLVILYERTKSIWAPIAAHMIFNLSTVINMLFSGTNSLL